MKVRLDFLSVLVLCLTFFSLHSPAQTPLPIASGGTGATTASAAIANLGLPIISVMNFGAKGDGVTDDTAAINSAMNACVTRAFPFNGCTLYFPSGIYITTGLTLQSYVHIKGDGWATSVIQLKPNTAADVLAIPADAFNFSITGVTLDGNSSHETTGGNCLSAATTPFGPNFINTANKQTASANGYKDGYIYGDMFSNCTMNGINIVVYNFELWFDDFFVYNNGVYGIYIQGTDALFSNFVSEHNGTSGLHVSNSNNKFVNAKIIFNGFNNTTEGAIYTDADRNIFTSIEAQDNYVSAFVDHGADNQFIGCQADTNGYANTSNNTSSQTASGFVIGGTNGVYSGDKVTDYRGRLSDGNFATEWPYTITNLQQSKIDITYDGTNMPPPTVAGDIVVTGNASMLPPVGIATSAATDAKSEPLFFRGSFWNGTAAVPSDWVIQHLLQSGFDQIAFTPPAPGTYPGVPAVILPQLFTATSSSGNASGVQLKLQSSTWNGTGPSFPGWILQSTVGTGTNPDSILSLSPYNNTGTPALQIHSNTDILNALQWGGGVQINTSSSVPQVGSAPLSGHAACIKSSGPPVVIGYCSTFVSSTGTCTCN
jgi:hypothetical protein